MEIISWIFDGIGTQIVGIIIGLLLGGAGGGVIGYRIGSKNKIKQKQKAGNNSNQVQVGNVSVAFMDDKKEKK